MLKKREYNWTDINETCPEFQPDYVDILLFIFALLGFFLSCMLINRFRKQLNGSVFLFTLAFVDMGYCLLYIYNFPLKSLAMYLESSLLSDVSYQAQSEIRMAEEFGNFFVPLLMMFIVFEKFFWTCSSRTRNTFRLFTVAKPKFILTAVTAVIGIFAMLVTTWNLKMLNFHFCDVIFLPFQYESQFWRIIYSYVIPLTILFTCPISVVFAAITLCRISKVGRGEKPVDQVDLANTENVNSSLTTSQVKKSIRCMLVVYFLFFLRGLFYVIFVFQHTRGIFPKDRHLRITRMWSYDFVNVVLSGSRILIYYVFCKNNLVVDFPPNALQTL